MDFTCDFVNFFVQRYRLFQQSEQEKSFSDTMGKIEDKSVKVAT